jgi:hypothetical protein
VSISDKRLFRAYCSRHSIPHTQVSLSGTRLFQAYCSRHSIPHMQLSLRGTRLLYAYCSRHSLCYIQVSRREKRVLSVTGSISSGMPPFSLSAATSLFCSVRPASASASTRAASATSVFIEDGAKEGARAYCSKLSHCCTQVSCRDKRALRVPGPIPSGQPPFSINAATSLFCSVRAASHSASTRAASANSLFYLSGGANSLLWVGGWTLEL